MSGYSQEFYDDRLQAIIDYWVDHSDLMEDACDPQDDESAENK